MRIKVKVVPRAKKERIEEAEGGLKIYLSSPAQKGKANKRLIELLADYFKTKKYNIRIARGHTQREKLIEIKEQLSKNE